MVSQAPLASCVCLTYARPHVLREAVWCFLQQDYPNKELIIVNDHEEPIWVEGDFPSIRVDNVAHRFANLGQKRNYACGLARGEYLLVWDDDDLYLPWRISASVSLLEQNREKWSAKPTSAWMSTNNQGYRIARNLFHSQMAIRREAFAAMGGYREMNSGQDQEFESRIPSDRALRFDASPSELFYVYRWGGQGVTHISGLGRDRPGEPTGWDRVKAIVDRRWGMPKGGAVVPGFGRNYWQDLLEAARRLSEVPDSEVSRLERCLTPYLDTGGRPS